MKSVPRMSLGGMMGLVALIAVHAALVRATMASDFALPVAAGPPLLVLELAAWRAWHDRRPGRAFWVGYLLLGGVLTGSLVWAGLHGAAWGRLPDGTYGVVRPASALNRLWRDGFVTIGRAAMPYLQALEAVPAAQLGFVLVLMYTPQFGAGWLGGRAARAIGPRLANHGTRPPRRAVPA